MDKVACQFETDMYYATKINVCRACMHAEMSMAWRRSRGVKLCPTVLSYCNP